MSNLVRLGRGTGFDRESTDPPMTRELIVVPWFDPRNHRMPYVYSLHLTVGDAETFIEDTPVRGRERTDMTGNFSKQHALVPNGSNVTPILPGLPIKYHGVAIIDLYRQHDIFDELTASPPGIVVTKADKDPHQHLAEEIRRMLLSVRGVVMDMRPGKNSAPTRWPMPRPT